MNDHAAVGTRGEEEPVPEETEQSLAKAKDSQDAQVVSVVKVFTVSHYRSIDRDPGLNHDLVGVIGPSSQPDC